MARGIKRSLVSKAAEHQPGAGDSGEATSPELAPDVPKSFQRASGGAGSAWKAGAVAQTQAELDAARERVVSAILEGDQVIEIAPDQITDPIGSDRRADWQYQEEFRALVHSIRENGQDTPVSVWPADPDWRPDELNPTNLERVQFLLLAGRRRCAAAAQLGRPVRAVLAPSRARTGENDTFEMLVLRFRENEEREALSPFERLVSIGEMYQALASSSDERIKAVEFARRIGVHESLVSRARTVAARKTEILNTFKNVYEMSFQELQRALSSMSKASTKSKKGTPKPKKISVTQSVGKQKLRLTGQGGKLSISGSGLDLDENALKGLGEAIAEYIEKHRSK